MKPNAKTVLLVGVNISAVLFIALCKSTVMLFFKPRNQLEIIKLFIYNKITASIKSG
jgi:hypothetical protein